MKQKIFALMLALIMVFAQTGPAFAKGFSSSKSFSSSRTSSFKGYSGSSSSKSSSFGSSSSSKSSGSSSFGSSSSSSSKSASPSTSGGSSSYSGSSSSSRSPFGSSSSGSSSSGGSTSSSSKSSLGGTTSSGSNYSGSSSSKSSSGSTGGSATVGGSSSAGGSSASGGNSSSAGSSNRFTSMNNQKTAYMENTYKSELSKNSYNTYKQNLNNDQQKAYDSAYSNTYRFNNRMEFDDMMRTRPQRISMFDTMSPRIRINNYYFGGPISYGSAFVGPWDLWFLMRASDLFWFHHWNDLYAYRDYFHADDFEARRLRVLEMEQQNIARDSSYVDPDIDYDLQFSPDYQQKHLNELYYTNRHPVGNPAGTVFGIVLIAVGLLLIIKFTSKPKRRRNSGGSIY